MTRTWFFFFFDDLQAPVKTVKKRVYVDYDFLYARIKEGPLTFRDIQELTGVSKAGVSQIITTMSLRFPVWSPKRGVYQLLD